MIKIPLKRRDGAVSGHALISDEDALLALVRWSLHKEGYARRGSGPTQWLHRTVLGLKYGDKRQADHRNRDKLDCRRENLRVVSRAENNQNFPAHVDSTSKHRGVFWVASKGKWVAQVRTNGRNHYFGAYANEQDAADAAARGREALLPFALD